MTPRRIAITGGPGGGKTTLLTALAQREPRFACVPEVATLIFRHVFPRVTSDVERQAVQRTIFHAQQNLELFLEARKQPEQVLLCDRGTPDGAAYWPAAAGDFFRALGTTLEAELARYDAVLFLETAAAGGHAICEGNEVRTEDLATALAIDARLRAVWSRHPRFELVPCCDALTAKLQRAVAVIDVWTRSE